MKRNRRQEHSLAPHGVPGEVVAIEVAFSDGTRLYGKVSGDRVMAAPETLESLGFADVLGGTMSGSTLRSAEVRRLDAELSAMRERLAELAEPSSGMGHDSKAVGRRIKGGLVDRGMSSDELADALGVSRQTVSAWMNDRASISFSDASKVCDVFGWSLDHLAVRDGAGAVR